MNLLLKSVPLVALTLALAAGMTGCEDSTATTKTTTDTAASADSTSDTAGATDASATSDAAGGDTAATGTDAASTDTAADAASDVTATKAYKDMTTQEKMAFMGKEVMPLMEKIVKKADPSKGTYLCANCHGATGPTNGFKMPNGLIPLDPKKLPPLGTSPLIDAMYKEVTPQVGALLGIAPFDAATGKGFGCFACHAVKK